MSKKSSLDEKTKIQIKIKDTEGDIPNESNRESGNINVPKVSGSNSNDISRLNSSFASSKPVDIASKANSETKATKKKVNFESSNILNLENEMEYIIKKDKEDDKRESNFFSEKALFDEINNAERDSSGENDNNLSRISNILNSKNKKYLDFIIQNKIINQQKHSRNSELYNASRSENNEYYNKKDIYNESISNSKHNMPGDYNSEDFAEAKNSGMPSEYKSKPKNETVVINSLYDKDKGSKLDLDNRINKINNKMNSIVKFSVPTNPSTFETELGSKITDNTSLYKNISIDNKSEKPSKASCFKSFCFSGTEKKKK